MIKIKKGLNLPITGLPVQSTTDSKRIRSVALLGEDYVGMKPTMMVDVGDEVKVGQPFFEDKKIQVFSLHLQDLAPFLL